MHINTACLLSQEVQGSENVMGKSVLRMTVVLGSETGERDGARKAAANVKTGRWLDRTQ